MDFGVKPLQIIDMTYRAAKSLKRQLGKYCTRSRKPVTTSLVNIHVALGSRDSGVRAFLEEGYFTYL